MVFWLRRILVPIHLKRLFKSPSLLLGPSHRAIDSRSGQWGAPFRDRGSVHWRGVAGSRIRDHGRFKPLHTKQRGAISVLRVRWPCYLLLAAACLALDAKKSPSPQLELLRRAVCSVPSSVRAFSAGVRALFRILPLPAACLLLSSHSCILGSCI